MTHFTPSVESALAACGRDKVMHNDRAPFAVAIRRDPITHPGEKWITAEGKDHDEAGRKAAISFALDLEERAKQLLDWSRSIHHALGLPR